MQEENGMSHEVTMPQGRCEVNCCLGVGEKKVQLCDGCRRDSKPSSCIVKSASATVGS